MKPWRPQQLWQLDMLRSVRSPSTTFNNHLHLVPTILPFGPLFLGLSRCFRGSKRPPPRAQPTSSRLRRPVAGPAARVGGVWVGVEERSGRPMGYPTRHTVVSEARWHKPTPTCPLDGGPLLNHRPWGLCHWSSQSTILL